MLELNAIVEIFHILALSFHFYEEISRWVIYFKIICLVLPILYIDVDIIRRRSLRREIGTYKGTWKGKGKWKEGAIVDSIWLICFLYTTLLFTALTIFLHLDEINNLIWFKILRLFVTYCPQLPYYLFSKVQSF